MIRKKDYLEELGSYIKRNLKKGYTKDSLKWALVNQGHSKIEVEKALKKVEEEMAYEAPVLETKPQINYEATPLIEPKKSFWKKLFG